MPAEPLQHLTPTNEELLQLVYRHVDDSMLREIAEADYGMDADAHLIALRAIKAGHLPVPLQWEPKEVLELIRWSEPEDPSWKPGSVGIRGHWMRLFSCAILIRAAGEPENDGYFTGEESTIIQLVDSAMKLGTDTSLATLRFLCWRMQYRPLDEWSRPYFAIAILLLTVSLEKCDPETVRFLIAAAGSDELALPDLFGQCQKGQTWHAITRRVLIESTNTSHDLQQFGKRLLSDTIR